MAAITGSSTTIDWSSISLAQVDLETDIVTFVHRVDQILTELDDPASRTIISRSSTLIVADIFSGGRVSVGGSGFGTSAAIINSFNFRNTGTGEVIRWTGTVDGIGNDFLTSATIGSTGLLETLRGTITVPSTFPPVGNFTGALTSLVVKIGAATGTFSGNFSLAGDNVSASLTGTVTGISVVSGANTIKMTGLSLSLDVLQAALGSPELDTVDDLFAFLSNHLPGNDTITYTNNSGVGMTFYGGGGNDTITISGPNADALNGGDGNDILIGGPGQDTVNGGAGNDQITMLVTVGNGDIIDAGADTDTLVLRGVVPGNHKVVVDLSSTTDQVVSIGGVLDNTLTQINFENLNASGIGSSVNVTGSAGANSIIGSKGNDTLIGGDGNDTLSGLAGNDTLEGDDGNDTLNGGLGADSMTGGLGDDTYVIDSLGDTITELAGEGNDTVHINRSVELNTLNSAFSSEIENVVLTGSAALNATGDDGNNLLTGNSAANRLNGGDGNDTLTGNAGNDTLNGGVGADAMDGGAGNDTYVVNSRGDSVTETLAGAAGGTDLVQSAAAIFVLGDNVENLTLTEANNINGTGNALNNILTGNSGDNVLSGGDGTDTLIGGAGNDTLDGGAGTDKMAGGLGDDTYVVNLTTDVVTEALNAGTDTVLASLNYRLGANVENLTLTGTDNINGTGNALTNVLTGNSANNLLSGLAGTDQLDGGDGNDALIGGAGQDTVTGGAGNDQITMLVTVGNGDIIDAGAGNDTLMLSGVVPGNHVVEVNLASTTDQVVSIGGAADALTQINFENLNAAGIGSVVNVTGSTSDNSIIGSKGNDTLIGGGGNDALSGLAGNDTFGFGLGDGQDLVQDNSGSADKISFDGGINPLDLVISRQANDLRLAIHGSSDQITVQNWYTSSVNRTETIQAGNDQTLLSTQVDQLIQAMAGFTQQTGLTWDQGIDQQPQQVQTILAANWQ